METNLSKSLLVFLRLRSAESACRHYVVDKNVLKVYPVEKMRNNKTKQLAEKQFEFSKIFDIDATQLNIYNETIYSSIQNAKSLTTLTYGTSGSGKTYTMYGTNEVAGIVQRAIAHIFTVNEKIMSSTPAVKIDKFTVTTVSKCNLNAESKLTATFVCKEKRTKNNELVKQIRCEHGFKAMECDWKDAFVWISFAEIYNENVYDLLKMNGTNRNKLKIFHHNGNAYINELTSIHVPSASDAYDVIYAGLARATYAETKINAHSSRSHRILFVNVIHYSHLKRYSLSTYKFCDLAGTERLKKTDHVGDRLKETQQTNKSLLVLGRCVELMLQNQQERSHNVLPFRDSKLTILLKKSLIGEEKMILIVTIAPKIEFILENLHVLNFATNAYRIDDKKGFQQFMNFEVNKHTDVNDILWQIRQLKAENKRLKKENQHLQMENFSLRNRRCCEINEQKFFDALTEVNYSVTFLLRSFCIVQN